MKTTENKPGPSLPRVQRTLEMAAAFLQEKGIGDFPIDPVRIIQESGWKLKTYTWLAATEGYEDPLYAAIFARRVFGSEDAVVYRMGQEYLITYNEHRRPKGRMLFSLMHEVGHIVLGHLEDWECGRLSREGLDGEAYRMLEAEADCFACNTLMPAILAKQFRAAFDPAICRRIFGVSSKAWETRLSLLSRDLGLTSRATFDMQRSQFWDFVTSKTCLMCGSAIVGLRKGQPCPHCGKEEFVWKNRACVLKSLPF